MESVDIIYHSSSTSPRKDSPTEWLTKVVNQLVRLPRLQSDNFFNMSHGKEIALQHEQLVRLKQVTILSINTGR
jgi:hypothetical protein